MSVTTYNSDIFTDEFSHIGLCASPNKTITQTLTIDDGTGKLFTYTLDKNLEWKEYTIIPDFSTNPQEPTIIDNTDIIPNISDPYDVVQTDGVDYEFFEDGTQLNNQETETIQQILSIPRHQEIKQDVRYFTGWEIKTAFIQKTIDKTNIPPETCNSLESNCFTVPVEIYTSCSTDQEDNPQNLKIDWYLYLDINSTIDISTDIDGNEVRTVVYDANNANWELQTSKINNPIFSWTYNNEGQYKLIETATDTDGASTDGEREFPIIFKACEQDSGQTQQVVQAYGEIELEKDVWQLCAIPMTTGVWDKTSHKIVKNENIRSTVKNVIIDQLEDVYNNEAKNLIKVVNAYVGDINKFYNYIPGFTKDTSEHNFKLVYTDDDMDVPDDVVKFEIAGFWVKAKTQNLILKWGIIE